MKCKLKLYINVFKIRNDKNTDIIERYSFLMMFLEFLMP